MSTLLPSAEEIARRIGRKIRLKRKRDDSTQHQVALAAGISVSFLSMIERGERLPTIETLYRLADALKMKPARFLD